MNIVKPFPYKSPYKFNDIKLLMHNKINNYSFERKTGDYSKVKDKEKSEGIQRIKDMIRLYGKDNYVISINEYPYKLENGLINYILWSDEEISLEEANRVAKNYMELKGYKNYLIFKNSRENRSIPNIPHIHMIFC